MPVSRSRRARKVAAQSRRTALAVVGGTSVVEVLKVAAGYSSRPTPLQLTLTALVAVLSACLVLLATAEPLKKIRQLNVDLEKIATVNLRLQRETFPRIL